MGARVVPYDHFSGGWVVVLWWWSHNKYTHRNDQLVLEKERRENWCKLLLAISLRDLAFFADTDWRCWDTENAKFYVLNATTNDRWGVVGSWCVKASAKFPTKKIVGGKGWTHRNEVFFWKKNGEKTCELLFAISLWDLAFRWGRNELLS